jgi:serine protease Do
VMVTATVRTMATFLRHTTHRLFVVGVFALAVVAALPCLADDANESLADREEAAFRAAAERVANSVVQIRTIGGLDAARSELSTNGPTTGLVISADGYIVTSTFNFTQQPASILVDFASGKQMPAELVATDESRMLVLLKVHDAVDLPAPEIAPADDVRVGQWAVAVGRTFRADRTNVSVGIISAKDRMFGKVVQTDANVSTANYGGPLVDIRGRVLGILVPMAPQGAGEVAGAEWYDSGIGFAVPLSSIEGALERMKNGEDQHAGILGVGLVAKSPHSAPAEVAAVRPDSPAGLAGLRKGDRVVEVDGRRIKTQTDLRFALGPLYGGDKVRVAVIRGDEQIERTITLAGKLKAFRHAFLGILPLRLPNQAPAEADDAKSDTAAKAEAAHNTSDGTADEDDGKADVADDAEIQAAKDGESRGVTVRMVYMASPAAEAGIQPGDRVVMINDADVTGLDDAVSEMNNVAPGGEVRVRVKRADEAKHYTLIAAPLPMVVPEQLPQAYEQVAPQADNSDVTGKAAEPPAAAHGKTRKLKLAEFKETCEIYVPASASADRPPGMLLWLHAPGDVNAPATIAAWQQICDRDNLLLVVPTAADVSHWERTELEYLRRLCEHVVRQYHPDPHRIAVYGQGGGGQMAWLLGLSSRDLMRGVATTAAPLPRQVRVPENEPAARLAFFAGISGDEGTAAQIAQGLEKLADAGYPVTTIANIDRMGSLSDDERQELARWIDTLDRF